jgi:hypothetical protein
MSIYAEHVLIHWMNASNIASGARIPAADLFGNHTRLAQKPAGYFSASVA